MASYNCHVKNCLYVKKNVREVIYRRENLVDL